jgi:predicted choloylglycine hydrolase
LLDYYPESLEEIQGISEGSNLRYEDVLMVNFASEIKFCTGLSDSFKGCTSFAATAESTANGESLMGKTRDLANQGYYPYQIAMRIKKSSCFEVFLVEAFSGMVVTGCGINEKGLGLILNTIPEIKDYDETLGVQRAFLARIILEKCRNTSEAIDTISEYDLAYLGANYLVNDASGDCAVIEKSHRHQALRLPKDGVVAMTNHFSEVTTSKFGINPTKSSSLRFQQMNSLLNENLGEIDVELAKLFLQNHGSELGDDSICQHHPFKINTIQAYILDLTSGIIHLSDGHPCERQFIRLEKESIKPIGQI